MAAGTIGEVAIKVEAGQRFYHNDPDATAATWRGDWVQSGDLGYFDEDGFLYLVDRKKDVIVRGGYNVSSIEVESALHEHPDVIEAAVLGRAPSGLGQDVAAVVRLRPRGGPSTWPRPVAFLADRVADYKRPRRIVVSTVLLPRTAMGKLDKTALREQLASARRLEQGDRRPSSDTASKRARTAIPMRHGVGLTVRRCWS